MGCYALLQGRLGSRQAKITEACDLEGLCTSVAMSLPMAALPPSCDNPECGFLVLSMAGFRRMIQRGRSKIPDVLSVADLGSPPGEPLPGPIH